MQNIKFQAPNPNEIPNSNIQRQRPVLNFEFWHCDLFGICILLFEIFSHSDTLVLQNRIAIFGCAMTNVKWEMRNDTGR
ncbi:MAG: hypothetical protein PVG64_05475, partial [Syntrophobacterales bacterium]